jgi:hypothetical protein
MTLKKKNIFAILNLRIGFLPRHAVFRERNTFFCGITKTIKSLFCEIFSEHNFDSNPSLRLTLSVTVDISYIEVNPFLLQRKFLKLYKIMS